VNPYSTALVHQHFKSEFDSPKPGWLRVGDEAQESIWIQDPERQTPLENTKLPG